MACSPGPRAAATADFGALARSCPLNSMAPVLAIADLVADRFLIDADRDPVGETLTPIATGPPLVSHTRGARAWPPHERQGCTGSSAESWLAAYRPPIPDSR